MKVTPKGVAEIAGTAGPVALGIGAAASAGSRTLSRRCCRGAASGGERPLSGGKYTWRHLPGWEWQRVAAGGKAATPSDWGLHLQRADLYVHRALPLRELADPVRPSRRQLHL